MSRFAKVPEAAVIALTPGQLRVYAALALYADANGLAWPSQSTLAEKIGLSRRVLQAHLADIEEQGFIESVSRRGTSNTYRLGGGRAPGVDSVADLRSSAAQVPCAKTAQGYDPQDRGGAILSSALTDQEQTKNRDGGRKRPAAATHSSLDEVFSDVRSDGKTWRDHWREKFPGLDLDEEAGDAWDHVARKKRTDMPRYLERWLREEHRKRARQPHFASRYEPSMEEILAEARPLTT